MPKVTLLGPPGKDYRFFLGKKEFIFNSGVTKDVPENVALELMKRVTRKNKPLFKVEEFEASATSIAPPEIYHAPTQNVSMPRQQRFATWL